MHVNVCCTEDAPHNTARPLCNFYCVHYPHQVWMRHDVLRSLKCLAYVSVIQQPVQLEPGIGGKYRFIAGRSRRVRESYHGPGGQGSGPIRLYGIRRQSDRGAGSLSFRFPILPLVAPHLHRESPASGSSINGEGRLEPARATQNFKST